jgi:2,3-diketo-5-methylthio-1-phosphopentane phosphatase
VTKEDVIDRLLEKFGDPKWMEIERSWVNGEIGSRDCLAMQTKLIRAKVRDLLDVLGSIHIDETFLDFVSYCRSKAFEIVILSDGIDLFIKSILERYGVNGIRVYSNSLGSTNGRFEMYFPYFRKDCLSRSGICKCKIMEELSSPSNINILVGDGRSDFCIARKADLTFAKSELLDFCRVEKIPHMNHMEFGDVMEWLGNQKGQEHLVCQRNSVRHGLRKARNG